jgi:hypothetical protein
MAEIGSGFIRIDASWLTIKSYIASKKLELQYDESSSSYEIFAIDGSIVYVCIIHKGDVPDDSVSQEDNDSYKDDFVSNYKGVLTNKAVESNLAYDGYSINTANPILIAGSDGDCIRTILTSADGYLLLNGLGSAGTPRGGVVSVQGIAEGEPLPVSQNGIWTIQPGNSANSTPWLQTINQGGNSAIVSSAGALKVDGSAITQPVLVDESSSLNITKLDGYTVARGAGSTTDGVQRVVLANDASISITGSVSLSASTENAYFASYSFVVSGNRTDTLSLIGSGTKTIKVKRFILSGYRTSGTNTLFSLVKRSTASVGTTTNLSAVATDSDNGSASAQCVYYTANPSTLGTSVGQMDFKVYIPKNTDMCEGVLLDERFDNAIVLRGTGQSFSLNFNNAAVAGGNLSATIWWTEE